MAFLSSIHFLSLPRWHHSTWPNYESLTFVQLLDFRFSNKWSVAASSRNKVSETSARQHANGNRVAVKRKTTRTSKRATSQTRKKANEEDIHEENAEQVVTDDDTNDENTVPVSIENSNKIPGRTRRKVASASAGMEEEKTEKKVRRRRNTEKMDDDLEDQGGESEISDRGEFTLVSNLENEGDEDLEFDIHVGDDIRHTYSWPPLVCCFGAAQHAFVPSAKPANRLINREFHETMKDALWEPENFVRAPGGCAGNVAIALASLGGKVAFMGKLGDDEIGEAMLYHLNTRKVQTRSVWIDSKSVTAVSQMKIAKRGRLKSTCVKPCAEDSLSKSEINIDVLKEAKMFYFNTHSLLDESMRSTMLQAIKISKRSGGSIFYDVNLPLPLWQSSEETKLFIKHVWNLANIIEVTKQELEFLYGIKSNEEFDSKNYFRCKIFHYEPEVLEPLWHENLNVLFVTNGTSEIHYYTSEYDGVVAGVEDPPITPFTCDLSASGDGVVAGLMRMLVVNPHLTTDKGYLEHSIKYAISCGVNEQWMLGRALGFPPKEGMEQEVEPDVNGIRAITEKEYRTIVI